MGDQSNVKVFLSVLHSVFHRVFHTHTEAFQGFQCKLKYTSDLSRVINSIKKI